MKETRQVRGGGHEDFVALREEKANTKKHGPNRPGFDTPLKQLLQATEKSGLRALRVIEVMDRFLAQQVAVVTGGTRGIGRAIVERLLREGASVAFCGRSGETLARAVEELSKTGGREYGQVLGGHFQTSIFRRVSDLANRRTTPSGGLCPEWYFLLLAASITKI